ncbi:hypothetical protein LXL04_007877 [Taraxacum kok-saghyz]
MIQNSRMQRFFISILPFLPKPELLRIFPCFVNLPLDKFQESSQGYGYMQQLLSTETDIYPTSSSKSFNSIEVKFLLVMMRMTPHSFQPQSQQQEAKRMMSSDDDDSPLS